MQGYRTLLFSLAIAIGGVFQAFDWATVIPQDKPWSGAAMIAIAAAIAAFRSITSTPVGTKSKPSLGL